jgi:hypothetical protein
MAALGAGLQNLIFDVGKAAAPQLAKLASVVVPAVVGELIAFPAG